MKNEQQLSEMAEREYPIDIWTDTHTSWDKNKKDRDIFIKGYQAAQEEMKWRKFEDCLPTNVRGEQIDILFGHPEWATYMRGMYNHYEEQSLRERLSEYKPDIDKFRSWESMMPTHWHPLPQQPLMP